MISSRCGLDCDRCYYRDQYACGGCIDTDGHPYHGECAVAKCCGEKGFVHCGQCPDLPCAMLEQYSDDPVHGDDPPGARIKQCRIWASGNPCTMGMCK